ncbi:MAG: hypothetical protein KDA97_10525, partial [Acidimicrobiales bacterium]|nr:hypothetical protein [Acidimicrobiales bacterium]
MSDDPNQPSDAPGGRPPWEPRPATSDQPWPSSPPTTGTPPPGPAGTPGTDPTVPGPVAPAPGAPATAGDDEGPAGARPRPALWSLVAAAGGLLAALGLVALLSEPDIADERALVVAVSAIFEVLGIVLVVLARDRRAAAGGVALSLLAALPLVNALVVDPNDLFGAFDDLDSLRNQQLTILGLLAIIWLALYAFGPARRYGALLGGALLAIWSIPMTWFSFEAV